VRLPEDHWIWNEHDKSAVVRIALEWYRQSVNEIKVLRQEVSEIKNTLNNTVITKQPTEKSVEKPLLSDVDPRLARAMDRLLDI
jgi:hypothetical protein